MIETETHGAVTVLRMQHGKANALDTEFCQGLANSIRAFEASDARAGVLTGTGSIFSAGVDLKRILEGGADYLDGFLDALQELFTTLVFCSKPMVGAANGHAIAGGCILLCACDLALLAKGKARVGAPELLVGVAVPGLALEILRAAVPVHEFERVVYTGKTFGPEDAQGLGLADELVEPEALLEEALGHAKRLGRIPAASFAATKALVRAPLSERIESQKAAEADVRAAWAAPDTVAAIQAFVEATLSR